MAVERSDVEHLSPPAVEGEGERNVLFMLQLTDLPLMGLGVAEIFPEEDFDSLVLKAVDGGSGRLMHQLGRGVVEAVAFVVGEGVVVVLGLAEAAPVR